MNTPSRTWATASTWSLTTRCVWWRCLGRLLVSAMIAEYPWEDRLVPGHEECHPAAAHSAFNHCGGAPDQPFHAGEYDYSVFVLTDLIINSNITWVTWLNFYLIANSIWFDKLAMVKNGHSVYLHTRLTIIHNTRSRSRQSKLTLDNHARSRPWERSEQKRIILRRNNYFICKFTNSLWKR